MTPERFRQIDKLVADALELAAATRAAFLAQACAGDEALRREVAAQLAAHERAEQMKFLSQPATTGFTAAPASAQPLGEKPMLLNGRYYIPDPAHPLGEGGFGKVYLAYDRNLHDRRVIVKTLKFTHDAGINDYMRRKFRGDIDALTRFRHPHIVGILDQGALPDGGEPFFVMDLIEGESLRDLMRRERLDFTRVARLIQQAGQAISYAHERGVYHRDLKPDNLMLRAADDSVVVIDFGIATVQEWKREQRRGDPPKKTMLAGTAEYMAPEQIRGAPEAASDTWALDVISFELLTGQLPFAIPRDAQTGQVQWPTLLNELQSGVRVRPTVLRPQLPAAVEDVLLHSLAFDPQRRHAAARAFGDALAAALLTAQAPAPALPPTEIMARPTSAITEPLDGGAPATLLHPRLKSLLALATPTTRLTPRLVNEAKPQRGVFVNRRDLPQDIVVTTPPPRANHEHSRSGRPSSRKIY